MSGAQQTTSAASSASRISRSSTGSRPSSMPMTRWRSPVTTNPSARVSDDGLRAIGVVRAVEDEQRVALHDLEPTRVRDARRRPPRRGPPRAGARRRPPSRPRRWRRSRPGGRRGGRGTRRRRSRPACAGRAAGRRRRAGSRCTRSRRRDATAPSRGSPSKTSCRAGSVSPSTNVAPGLTMPAFSSAMRRRQSPLSVRVVVADVGEHGHLAVDDVRGVPSPEQAHLDHGRGHGLVGEPSEGRRREQLEVGRPVLEQPLDAGQVGEHVGQRRVARSADRCGRSAR